MELTRGFRGSLESAFDVKKPITIDVSCQGPAVYDVTCFGLDKKDVLCDEGYMIFYNQPKSPAQEIVMEEKEGGACFAVCLAKLPPIIEKLSFTVTIDGAGVMGEVKECQFLLRQPGREDFRLFLTGSDFANEKAVIAIELYKKDTWRISAVARGFDGGLSALLKNFGGVEDTASLAPETNKISLEKKLEKEAPKLVSLAKPLKVVLEKKHLTDTLARVSLVLDISGSMRNRYKNGTVQNIVNKTVPLAIQFDDNGELDFWFYGTTPKRMPAVTGKNYEISVPEDYKALMRELGGTNNEPLVMREVIKEYEKSVLPAYVLFITDGGVSREGEIKRLMRESSHLPIFWQFVGVGGSGYGILKKLDNLDGRLIDNANFFELDDFDSVENEVLYDRLLGEFPQWLKAAREKGIISNLLS